MWWDVLVYKYAPRRLVPSPAGFIIECDTTIASVPRLPAITGGVEPQDLLWALSLVDRTHPHSQVGDAARRAAREVQRVGESGETGIVGGEKRITALQGSTQQLTCCWIRPGRHPRRPDGVEIGHLGPSLLIIHGYTISPCNNFLRLSLSLSLFTTLGKHVSSSKSPLAIVYRLFISAYMITSKVICDDTYSKQHCWYTYWSTYICITTN